MPDPKRGEVYWINFDPVQGSEQGGRRPALVIQNDRGNRSAPTTVVAIISSALLSHTYPFTVPLAAGEGGLPKEGHVNCAQIRTIDKRRLERLAGSLTRERMSQVKAALLYELELE
jgi:mRNA interferase MazF